MSKYKPVIAGAAVGLLGYLIGVMSGSQAAGLVVMVIFLAYWLPTLVAYGRHVSNVGQVAIINGLLGWSFVGWVVALVMAAKPVQRQQHV